MSASIPEAAGGGWRLREDRRSAGQAPARDLSGLLPRLPAVQGDWPALSAQRLNAFICCDGPYLERHGLAFARSVDRNAPGGHLHVHLINPDTATRARLTALGLGRTRLSQSWEHVDFSGCSADFARTYCASIRFVRQHQLLRVGAQPVFSFDVDVLLRGRLDRLLADLARGGYDCAVHSRLRTRKRREKFLVSAFYVAPTTGGRAFLADLAAQIAAELLAGGAKWYMDQLAFYDCYRKHRRAAPPLRLYHLPRALSDWDFDKRSLLWVAKGWRKDASAVFRAHQDAYRTAAERCARLPRPAGPRPRVGIVLPRLDLPFTKPSAPKDLWSLARGPRAHDRALRRHWAAFADLLGDAFRGRGCDLRRIEVPLWRVTTAWVEALDVDLVFLPHTQRFELPGLRRPAWFYMQQAFPWLFSLDPLGWSAAGARYPCDDGAGDPARGTFERYAERLVGGNASKLAQPPRRRRHDLVAQGEIPPEPYIFLPCQRPNDRSIRYFCDHDAAEVVAAVAGWAQRRGMPLVLKAHPGNPASARPLRRAAEGTGARWSDASVHDLIAHSAAVYVVNSGVGLEALLHDKPVATFGRVEYDAVTVHGDLGALDRTWQAVTDADPARRRSAYRRFLDWYCRLYCVDMSDRCSAEARLAGLVGEVLAGSAEAVAVNREASPPAICGGLKPMEA